jgi:uncharacterized membrane protein
MHAALFLRLLCSNDEGIMTSYKVLMMVYRNKLIIFAEFFYLLRKGITACLIDFSYVNFVGFGQPSCVDENFVSYERDAGTLDSM